MPGELTTPAMQMVAFFTDGNEARAAQSALADENIPCLIVNSRSGPEAESIPGYRLLVPPQHVPAAESLLDPQLSIYIPEENEPTDEIVYSHGKSWYIALILCLLAALSFIASIYTTR